MIDRGLDAVIANLTGVIGPYDFTPSRMGAVFLALGRGKFPATIGGGFDWVDARDVANSLLVLEAKGRTGENYLLSGNRASFSTLAKLAAEVTGLPAPRFTVPMAVAKLAAPGGLWWAQRTGSEPMFTPESLHALATDPTVSGQKAARSSATTPAPPSRPSPTSTPGSTRPTASEASLPTATVLASVNPARGGVTDAKTRAPAGFPLWR